MEKSTEEQKIEGQGEADQKYPKSYYNDFSPVHQLGGNYAFGDNSDIKLRKKGDKIQ